MTFKRNSWLCLHGRVTIRDLLLFVNMSNLSVLSVITRLRSINSLVRPSVRCIIISSKTRNWNTDASKCSVISRIHSRPIDTKSQPIRLIHTDRSIWKNDSTTDGKEKTLDQFRAEEERIEREAQQQQQQQSNDASIDGKSAEIDGEHQEKVQKIRVQILDASLQFVSKHGWSVESIQCGAESINYPGVAHGLFPSGAIELIQHFYLKCNRELIEKLQEELSSTGIDSDGKPKPVEVPNPRDFSIKAIRMRLEMIQPFIDTWPQAIGFMTLPQNVPASLAQLLTLVDDICYCAGDRSVDIGWYTRRIGIASIYKMVELFMLQDKSVDHQKTWEFLERRVDEGIQLQEFLINSEQTTKTVTKALDNVFQTARNVLGINNGRR